MDNDDIGPLGHATRNGFEILFSYPVTLLVGQRRLGDRTCAGKTFERVLVPVAPSSVYCRGAIGRAFPTLSRLGGVL
jgi:hypothetical protein